MSLRLRILWIALLSAIVAQVALAQAERIESEADYAEALAELAVCYDSLREFAAGDPGRQEQLLADSLATARRALALDEESELAHRVKGRALKLRLDRRGSERAFRRALEIAPGQATARLSLAAVLMEGGRLGEAHELLRETVAIDPLSAYAHRQLGRGELYRGDYDAAIRLDDRSVSAHSNRGILRLSRGELAGAIADFTFCVRLAPRQSAGYLNRGAALRRSGRFREALADFDRALRLDPDQTDALNNRGLLRKQLGNPAGALADFERLVRLPPEAVVEEIDRMEVLLRRPPRLGVEDRSRAALHAEGVAARIPRGMRRVACDVAVGR